MKYKLKINIDKNVQLYMMTGYWKIATKYLNRIKIITEKWFESIQNSLLKISIQTQNQVIDQIIY